MNRCWAFFNFAAKYCLQILMCFLTVSQCFFTLWYIHTEYYRSRAYGNKISYDLVMDSKFWSILSPLQTVQIFQRSGSLSVLLWNAFEIQNNSHFSYLSGHCSMFYWCEILDMALLQGSQSKIEPADCVYINP